jgi:hypothetical protein
MPAASTAKMDHTRVDAVVKKGDVEIWEVRNESPCADRHTPYTFHCHILEHEDLGMMGQFVVVDDPSQDVTIQSPLTGTQTEAPTDQHQHPCDRRGG